MSRLVILGFIVGIGIQVFPPPVLAVAVIIYLIIMVRGLAHV